MTIVIVHDRTEGTRVYGTTKGDGSGSILRAAGFRTSRNLPDHPEHGPAFWYLPHSQRRRCKMTKVGSAAAALREAGFTVAVTVDDITPCQIPFADLEAAKYARAGARATRYDNRATGATGTGEALQAQVRAELDQIPMGQPHLVGHHSYNRSVRAAERRHAKTRRAIAEMERGEYWAGRAEAAAAFEEYRRNVPRTRRRIEELEANLRRYRRTLDGDLYVWDVEPDEYGPDEGLTLEERLAKHCATLVRHHVDQDGNERGTVEVRIPLSEQARAVLAADIIETEEEIAYWRSLVAAAAASGVKVWTARDFKRGDFMKYHGTWFEVARVNAKSLTIPAMIAGPGNAVVTLDGNPYSWTDRIPYDKVEGRKTAREIEAMLATKTDQNTDPAGQTG